MNDQRSAMAAVLSDFQPLGEDHPVAQETYEAVKSALEQRAHGATVPAPSHRGLLVRPGDTLVLTTTRPVAGDQAAALREGIEGELPGVRVLLLDGVQVGAVYRGDDDD